MECFLIVDMQNDFMPGGPLGVPGADKIVPVINGISSQSPLVIVTHDWHPPDHMSFVTSHPGQKVGDIINVKGVEQILWPVHCVRNTHGAELVAGLNKSNIESYFYKGTDKWIDSYSAFFDNARRKSTGLGEYLQSRNVKEVAIAGVATDYCVLYTAIDALDLGFSVTIIEDACCGINLSPNDVKDAFVSMKEKGAKILSSKDIE